MQRPTINRNWIENSKDGKFFRYNDLRCKASSVKHVLVKVHLPMVCADYRDVNRIIEIIKNTAEDEKYTSILFNFKVRNEDSVNYLREGAGVTIYVNVIENEGLGDYRAGQFIAFIHDVCFSLKEEKLPKERIARTDQYIKGTYGFSSYRLGNCTGGDNRPVYDFAGNCIGQFDYYDAKKIEGMECPYNPNRLEDPVEYLLDDEVRQRLSSPSQAQPGIFRPLTHEGVHMIAETLTVMAADDSVPAQARSSVSCLAGCRIM